MPDRMYFAKPDYDTIGVGSLVWYYRTDVLLGPFLIVDKRYAGYGNNSKRYWILFDSSRKEYHQADTKYLRVPQECV